MSDAPTGESPQGETSTKPYMVRALYEWCCDNGYTPYLAVTVDAHTLVPRQYVKGGEIVLNVSPSATSRMTLGNELIEFQARFGGVAQQLSIPVPNVSAIYARETGHGMAFEVSRTPPMAQLSEVEGQGQGVGEADGGDVAGDVSESVSRDEPGEASARPVRAGRRSHLSDVSARPKPSPVRAVDPDGGETGGAPVAESAAGGTAKAAGKASGEVIAFGTPTSRRQGKGSATGKGASTGRAAKATKDPAPKDDAGDGGDDDGGGNGTGGGATRGKTQLTRIK